MTEVFADSFYYLALLNPADQHHAAALQATKNLQSRIVTTPWVLMEVGDALSHPSARALTHRFLMQVQADANTVIIPFAESWYRRGLALYGSRLDKGWSLTDCISFEVMNARQLTEAITGDHHFVQAGFRILL
jgi:hypothetical protein